MELLQKLLKYDPDERILARQALRDPYFRELHEMKKEALIKVRIGGLEVPRGCFRQQFWENEGKAWILDFE